MKNLKITFFLETPLIANRLLTIDNLLLNIHYNLLKQNSNNNSFINIEDDLENLSQWIEVKNSTISGSVWFINKDENILLENIFFNKSINRKDFFQYTGKKNIEISRGEFKAYRIGEEAIITNSIYFYVRGDKKYIENLLKHIKFVGKKISIGFGKIKKYKIEEIAKDKSFMIDKTTPAKPLSCRYWDIKSKKVAFFRGLPPYWEVKGKEPCYMPTTSLIEMKDNSYNNEDFIALTDIDYISASNFVKNNLASKISIEEVLDKIKNKVSFVEDNCIICGQKAKCIKANPKKYLPSTFNDFPFLRKGDTICVDCFWSMKAEKEIGNLFINKETFYYIAGNKMPVKTDKEKREFKRNFYLNLDKLKPPFFIGLKTTSNTQHIVFKGQVSISNTMIPIQIGNDTVLVDIELLKEAINDLKRILENNPCITKVVLTNFNQIDNIYPKLKNICRTKENYKILSDFYKKYDRGVRRILSLITF